MTLKCLLEDLLSSNKSMLPCNKSVLGSFYFTRPSIFKTIMTVEAKCVPHYKSCNHLNSVEPSGNCLLICGNPTRPASLVTTETSKPTLIISVTALQKK